MYSAIVYLGSDITIYMPYKDDYDVCVRCSCEDIDVTCEARGVSLRLHLSWKKQKLFIALQSSAEAAQDFLLDLAGVEASGLVLHCRKVGGLG